MAFMETNVRQHNEATARILAATLTLISRERRGLPPPYSLWYPDLNPRAIKDLALDVAFDRARALWVDEGHPARGLLIFHPQELESGLLGFKSARLKGPYVVDLNPVSRQKTALSLAAKGQALASRENFAFLSVKLPHDPALIRGFTEAGFSAAEITTVLEGPIRHEDGEAYGQQPKLSGILIRPSEEEDVSTLLSQLGDLFYDGHHLHSPFLPDDFSRKLWRRLAEDGLSAGDVGIFAKDQRQGAAVGLAMAKLSGADATLTVLHVNEEKRNQGLGQLLLKNLYNVLHEKGGRTIRAETASWNLPALALYINMGLRPLAPLIALHAKI
jgi:ribosomal protein S18 acetylase RimI-like enzyme